MEPARALYSAVGLAALPLLPFRLWWRGRNEQGYREHVGERFGRYDTSPISHSVLWVHAVSVGETRAAMPLIQRLRAAFPQTQILLTHMTATGRETGRALFGDTVIQRWLPYDVPFAVQRFFEHFHPLAGFLIETELWPNLVARGHALGIPLYLVNARLSERSAAGYRRVSALSRPMLGRLAGIAAQTPADAARLATLGGPSPIVTGNLKFDVEVPSTARTLGSELRLIFGPTRPSWIAASTRDGEEALILDALAGARLPPQTLSIIVPRHPQRFAVVAELLRSRGIPFARRSDNRPVPADVSIVLGDSMGEMMAYYAAVDVAFVGGSLLPLGGQNLIEPLALGTPVLIGPHTFNFTEAATGAIASGAALRVDDAASLVSSVNALLSDAAQRDRMRAAALAFHSVHRGAADRLWDWLRPQLTALKLSPSDHG